MNPLWIIPIVIIAFIAGVWAAALWRTGGGSDSYGDSNSGGYKGTWWLPAVLLLALAASPTFAADGPSGTCVGCYPVKVDGQWRWAIGSYYMAWRETSTPEDPCGTYDWAKVPDDAVRERPALTVHATRRRSANR